MKKITNKLFKGAMVLSALLLVSSCDAFGTPTNDDNVDLDISYIPLLDDSQEFELGENKLKTYFYKGGNVPLVDFREYVTTLEGYIQNQGLSWKVSENGNYEKMSFRRYGYTYAMTLNWEKNIIHINNLSVTNHSYPYSSTDYGSHLKFTGGLETGSNELDFYLDDYDIDILYVNKKVLIPQSILNVFFGSVNYQNVIYNGDNFIFTDTPYLNHLKSSKNGTTCPKDVREASVSTLLFTLDYFYGLKEHKNIRNGFKAFIGEDLLEKLKSTDPNIYFDAYYEILQKKLNEFHTNLTSGSVYHDINFHRTIDLYDEEKSGTNWIEEGPYFDELERQYEEHFGDDAGFIKRKGNTAIVTFDSFSVAPTAEIKNSDGSYKEDAYTKDTYAFFLTAMNLLKNEGGIKNVILDITQNGGGNVGCMYEALGFLTNRDIQIYGMDVLSDYGYLNTYAVDTDNDGDYKDDDAFTDFKFSILTSHYTFSAANAFAAIAKNMGIAKIIGQRSGGGMCSVLPCVLPDGTYYRMSSNNLSNMYINDEFVEIESGIAPDVELTMDQLYDIDYLNTLANTF